MELLPESHSTRLPFPIRAQDWQQTPPAVQAYLHTLRDGMGQLQERVESLEARLHHGARWRRRPGQGPFGWHPH
jgi:hypothetical protein